jgi:hypothetical protein
MHLKCKRRKIRHRRLGFDVRLSQTTLITQLVCTKFLQRKFRFIILCARIGTMNTKTFSNFTDYFNFLQDLLNKGFIHTNETFGKIAKDAKIVTTTFAGQTCIEIQYTS